MRYFGMGCEASEEEAKRLIDRALEKGVLDMMAREAIHSDPYMQLRLGWLYDMGWGVEQSCFRALAWYSGARMMGLGAAEEFIRKLTARLEGMHTEGTKGLEIADTPSD
jgi:TPR repeat protein